MTYIRAKIHGKGVMIMRVFRDFYEDESGITVIEIVLVLVDIPTKKERQRYSV